MSLPVITTMHLFFKIILNGESKYCDTVLKGKKMWREKNLNGPQNRLYKMIISYLFICIKMQPGLILESLHEIYHSKKCWIVKGLTVQFCKQHHMKVVSLDQKYCETFYM